MISGNKPSGYILTSDNKITAETRQCTHCQYMWLYKPGSGNKYGFCTFCNGLLCKKCVYIKWKSTSRGCIPFREAAFADNWMKKYILNNQLGIFIPK